MQSYNLNNLPIKYTSRQEGNTTQIVIAYNQDEYKDFHFLEGDTRNERPNSAFLMHSIIYFIIQKQTSTKPICDTAVSY